MTAPQGGRFGMHCMHHSAYTRPIHLVKETVKTVQELTDIANEYLNEEFQVYAGLLGTSGLGEIAQDVHRMQVDVDKTLVKITHHVKYVDASDGQSAHDVARDAERVLAGNWSFRFC